MVLIVSADEMLRKGLQMGGFDDYRQQRVRRVQNLERFKGLYGSTPKVYSQIFEDLQTTEIAEARVDPKTLCIDSYLMAIHFLKCYPTENRQSGLFKICEKTARKWAWFYSERIRALKAEKVSF